MMDNYKINPCKACLKNFDVKDINNINQCCYNTLGAFEGLLSLNDINRTKASENCVKCVQDSINALGRDRCNFRITAYPSWVQVPHYLPELLKTNDFETAKTKCVNMCKKSTYPNECNTNCKIDADAVEPIESFMLNPSNNVQNSVEFYGVL